MSPTPAHPIPDRHGVNLFTSDPPLRELLPLYLPADLVEHLLPHLTRLGALAGGVLDELAYSADQHPPMLQQRTCSGIDVQRILKHASAAASSIWPLLDEAGPGPRAGVEAVQLF